MSRGITLADALEVFSEELGDSFEEETSRRRLIRKIQSGIEFMLLHGGGDILHQWVVRARAGKFTFPALLHTPVKYRIGTQHGSPYGIFYNAYYPYSTHGFNDGTVWLDWNPNFFVSPSRVPTEFTPPRGGGFIMATTRDSRDVGKKIMVNGKYRGREVAPMHNGFKTAGELLTIYAEDDPKKKHSNYKFDEITSVVKEPTCAYTMLSGITENGNQFFLSHYHPDEEQPQYKEGILDVHCPSCDFDLHVLGRIDPTKLYTRDEELLPITSYEVLNYLAKRARYDASGSYNEVAVMETRIANIIRKALAYQSEPGSHLSIALPASGYTLTNI